MIKRREIIDFPYKDLKIGNYVKESKITKVNFPVLTAIRKNGFCIEELIFAIFRKKGESDYLSCTAICPVLKENGNYEKYRKILNL